MISMYLSSVEYFPDDQVTVIVLSNLHADEGMVETAGGLVFSRP